MGLRRRGRRGPGRGDHLPPLGRARALPAYRATPATHATTATRTSNDTEQGELFATYRHHGFITNSTLELVRAAGVTGRVLCRADSADYGHAFVGTGPARPRRA